MMVLIEIVDGPKSTDNWFVGIASKRITLEDGDSASEDLTATKLGAGRVAGSWNPAENPLTTHLSISYELDDGSGEFWVGGCELRDSARHVLTPSHQPLEPADAKGEQPFDCPLRDVTFLPGRYRVFVMGKDNHILKPEEESLTTCGIHVESKGVALACKRASQILPDTDDEATTVQFTSPPQGQSSDITSDSVFAWKAQPHSVYAIELRPSDPFNLVPTISLFTSKTSFRWFDLAAYGIGFPPGHATALW